MSRIGRAPIKLGAGVSVEFKDRVVTVKGPMGTLTRKIENDKINVTVEDGVVHVTRSSEEKAVKAAHGLYRALIHNMVVGVEKGYAKNLIINGVGYKAQMQGKKLVLNIGYSHPIEIDPPEGITLECPSLTEVVVKGFDKTVVGQVAANIRAKRVVEPYHGYGIRYKDETVVIGIYSHSDVSNSRRKRRSFSK